MHTQRLTRPTPRPPAPLFETPIFGPSSSRGTERTQAPPLRPPPPPPYYSLYVLFVRWQAAALGEDAARPPPGLDFPPVRSAEADWPLGAVLPAVICLGRSRRARLDRLRSMRRWHMLYTAHGTMVPRSFSHVACLAKARRSYSEYGFYLELAHDVVRTANGQVTRARLRYGLRLWFRVIGQLDRHGVWGAFSTAGRVIRAWAHYVTESGERRAVALSLVDIWLTTDGRKRSLRVAMHKLRAHASSGRKRRNSLEAVVRGSARRGVGAWAKANSALRHLRQYARATLATAVAHWRGERLREGLMAWRRVAAAGSAAERSARRAAAHSIRLASARLRRGWWVWIAITNVHRSLLGLTVCAHARVSAHAAWRLWSSRAASGELSLGSWVGAQAEQMRLDWHRSQAARAWRLWRRLVFDRAAARLQLSWVALEKWPKLALRRAGGRWAGLVVAWHDLDRIVRAVMHRRTYSAWRAWLLCLHERRTTRRTSLSCDQRATAAFVRSVAGSLSLGIRLWRGHVASRRKGTQRQLLGGRVFAAMQRRESARGFRSMREARSRRLAARALLGRGRRAAARWRSLAGWSCWRSWHRRSCEGRILRHAASQQHDTTGVRRAVRRAVAYWREEAEHRLLAAAAATRWRRPTLAWALDRLGAWAAYCRGMAMGAALFVRRRRGRAFNTLASIAESRRMAHSLMEAATDSSARRARQLALLEWRRVCAFALRAEAHAARTATANRLNAAAHKWSLALKRHALAAIRAEARAVVKASKKHDALGRALLRIDKWETVREWRGFLAWDLHALAAAADAFPNLHRRTHLRHWRAITAAHNQMVATGTRALARWSNRTIAAALCAWMGIVRTRGAVRDNMVSVARRWRRRTICAAVRTWRGKCEALAAALEALHRSVASWRLVRLARGWRSWSEMVAAARGAMGTMRFAVYRLAHQTVSRAIGRWVEMAESRRRAEALLYRVLPRGRKLHRAWLTWSEALSARERVLVAIAGAIVHRDAHLMRRVCRAWRGVTFKAETERRGLAHTMAALHGAARAFRTWAWFIKEASRFRELLRPALNKSFFRTRADAFGAIRLDARITWLRSTSARRWCGVRLAYAFDVWRDEHGAILRAAKLDRRAVLYLFAEHVPHAWRAWWAQAEKVVLARRLERRSAKHWRGHGYLRAWDRWLVRARDRHDIKTGLALVQRQRHAFRRLRLRARAWAAIESASFATLAARRGTAIAAWHAHAAATRTSLSMGLRAVRVWRRVSLVRAIERVGESAERHFQLLLLLDRADERRAAVAIALWSSWSAEDAQNDELMRQAGALWLELGAAAGFYSWQAEVRHRRRIDACTCRWVGRRLALGMNTWVEHAVRVKMALMSVSACLTAWDAREEGRAWRTWRSAAARRKAARKLRTDSRSYWRHLNLVDAWTRWALACAEADRRSEDGSADDYATGTGTARGGAALSVGAARRTTVVVFGSAAFGQLGHGSDRPLVVPTRLAGLGALRVRAAACGDYHTALLSSDGEVFTFGIGEYGVLGHGNDERSVRPRRVEALVGEHAISAACGWRHTLCLTGSGRLYSWGHGGFGQLGHGGMINFFLPLQLQASGSAPNGGRGGGGWGAGGWQQVSCGWRHSAALGEGGVAFTWGDGEHYALGHGERRCELLPRLVSAIGDEALRQLECGAHHTVAVGNGGRVYTWGAGTFGQLGHGERRPEAVPRLVSSLVHIEAVRVACGSHTCILGAHGELYTFGHGKHGQLGHSEARAESMPRRVHALRNVRVVGIACGDLHSLALADDGGVYTWGSGSHGELGHGGVAHEAEPRRIESLRQRALVFAACGASHNVLLLAPAAAAYADESDVESDSNDESVGESATTAGRGDY